MTTAPKRSPRKSLTKSQLETPEAVELLALLQTVTDDGRLLDDEIAALRQWLDDNSSSGLPAVLHLRDAVSAVLADGRVSAQERAWLQKQIETVMPREHRDLAAMRRREAVAESRAAAAEAKVRMKAEAREAAERRRSLTSFDFMVAGVTYEGRAKIVRKLCQADDYVELVREPSNRYSKNAILVRLQTGHDVGYVPEFEAERLAPYLDDGALQSASVKKVLTGRRAATPVVWGELYAPGTDVSHAKLVPPAAGAKGGRALAWLILLVAAVVLALAVWG